MKCKVCGSQAINQHLHGRIEGHLAFLCDVCYWRDIAESWREKENETGLSRQRIALEERSQRERAEKAEAEVERLTKERDDWEHMTDDANSRANKAEVEVERMRALLRRLCDATAGSEKAYADDLWREADDAAGRGEGVL